MCRILPSLVLSLLFVASASAQNDGGMYDPDNCRDTTLFGTEQETFDVKKERELTSVLNSRSLSKSDRELLELAASAYVYSITDTTFEDKPRQRAQEAVRKYSLRSEEKAKMAFLEYLTEMCRDVLRQCNVGHRLNAIIFLSELEQEKRDLRAGTPAVPYWEAGQVYLDVIENPKEETMVKVKAAEGLARIFRDGKAPRDTYNEMFTRTAKLLTQVQDGSLAMMHGDDYRWWLAYQLTLALGEVDTPANLLLEPVGVVALTKVLADPKQPDFLRAKAVRSLSKVPYAEGSGFDIGPIITAQMQFARDWLTRYNADPTHWENRHVAADLYFSFKPEQREQFEAGEGWLAQIEEPTNRDAATAVRTAFDAYKPIFKEIVSVNGGQQKPLDRTLADAVEKWLGSSPPTGKVHSRVPAIEITTVAAAPAAE